MHKSKLNLLYFHFKILLQADHVDRTNIRVGCSGIYCDVTGCVGRRTRQKTCVSSLNVKSQVFALTRKSRGAYAAIVSFLAFSMIQFRDGPFIRPHPAFWRIALGINLLYELALVFLLFQDLDSARNMMTLIDPSLGVALPEKNYAESCEVNATNIWVSRPRPYREILVLTLLSRMRLTSFVWPTLWV